MNAFLGKAAVALLLAGQVLASPLEAASALSGRAAMSGCDQGTCPDNDFGLDILGEPGSIWGWNYNLRWKGKCGCSQVGVSEDGCGTLDTCTGRHSVCLDWRSRRGHWVNQNGHKTCYSLDTGYVCAQKEWEAWPTAEVACTW